MKMTEQEKFWRRYYEAMHFAEEDKPSPWLDLSNERVQAQHFGLALEATGPVHGRRCLGEHQ